MKVSFFLNIKQRNNCVVGDCEFSKNWTGLVFDDLGWIGTPVEHICPVPAGTITKNQTNESVVSSCMAGDFNPVKIELDCF